VTVAAAACGGVRDSAFAWLVPTPAPPGWATASIPSGARLAYPSAWRRLVSDRGAASAGLTAADGRLLGYLNITPRQGGETVADWPSFRIAHNAREGDRDVRRLAAAKGLRFRGGSGSCVKDSYTTRIGARYVEIACLVAASTRATVIVAAAPPAAWSRESRVLERAIMAFRA